MTDKPITADVKAQVAANLRSFGYSVTDEYVAGQIDLVVASGKPIGIIQMMAQSQLKQNGYLA